MLEEKIILKYRLLLTAKVAIAAHDDTLRYPEPTIFFSFFH
jgi:hypothetical protein